MKALYLNRLTKLADHLHHGQLGHEKFDFNVLNDGAPNKDGCGTAGCAIGECPIVFPRSWKFIRYVPSLRGMRGMVLGRRSAKKFFGITDGECGHLFYPTTQEPSLFGGRVLGDNAGRKSVAKNIYEFIKGKKNGTI